MDICILLGSKSDLPVSDKCTAVLSEFGISHEVRVASAHRAPKYLEDVVASAIDDGCKIFIGMAGMAAALPGVVAAMSDSKLAANFSEWRKSRTARVIADDESLRE